MKKVTLLTLLFFISGMTLHGRQESKIVTKDIIYNQAGKTYQGYLAYPAKIKGKLPGILLVHEWTGLNDYARSRTRQLADLGYIAFAMDMYGKGIRAKNHKEAAALSGVYKKDRNLMRARMYKALKILKSQKHVNKNKIAAIGYCFGGTSVLELALSGSELRGIVSFHGVLVSPNLPQSRNIKAKVLIHHGADDRAFPDDKIKELKQSFDKAGVNYTFVSHPGAVHAFTNPGAGNDPTDNIAYNRKADIKSWKSMTLFLEQIFKY